MNRRELLTLKKAPSSGHFLHQKWQTVSNLPLWIHHPFAPHSITSSAVASSVGGTLMLSIRAVSALMTNSNLLD